MNNYRQMAPAAFVIALILIAVPVVDALTSVWPVTLGNAQWRYGFVGIWSNAEVTPLIGALIVVTTATGLGYKKTQLVSGVLAWLMVALTLGMCLSFFLDSVQTAPLIRAEAQKQFRHASYIAEFKLVFSAAGFATLAWACRVQDTASAWYSNFLAKRAGPARR